jgi:hypothetical protein
MPWWPVELHGQENFLANNGTGIFALSLENTVLLTPIANPVKQNESKGSAD